MLQESLNEIEINWNALQHEGKGKLIENKRLTKKLGEKVYCHDVYAEDLCELYKNMAFVNKEIRGGMILKIVDITKIKEKELDVLLEGCVDAVINLEGEKRFFSMIGLTQSQFIENLQNPEWKNLFLNQNYHVKVEFTQPYNRVSLYGGQVEKTKKEFFEQINKPTSAYYGKILGKNHGGFMINVQGVEGFLPGSLAATNVVRNFDDMIGKEIPVMVEDFLSESNTFIFSYKKYVANVLPKKIDELNKDIEYTGTITGTAKYGLFVEFNDIFTGLIHASKMTPRLKEMFKNQDLRPGDEISFWIKEITHDKKIILTDEDPSIRLKEIFDFYENNAGLIQRGEVSSIHSYGTIIRFEKDILGMIPQKELENKKQKYNIGDKVMVCIDKIQNDKIYLTLPSDLSPE